MNPAKLFFIFILFLALKPVQSQTISPELQEETLILPVNDFIQEVSGITLPAGTPVILKNMATVGTKEEVRMIAATVVNDVVGTDHNVLIKAGTEAFIQVQKIKARGMGKPGYIYLQGAVTTTVDNKKVLLSSENFYSGEKRGILVAAFVAGGFLFVGPFSFVALLLKGGEATIKADTIIVFTVAQEV